MVFVNPYTVSFKQYQFRWEIHRRTDLLIRKALGISKWAFDLVLQEMHGVDGRIINCATFHDVKCRSYKHLIYWI